MRYFLSIIFLFFVGLFFNNSFASSVDDVVRSSSPVPTFSSREAFDRAANKREITVIKKVTSGPPSRNRRQESKWSGWGADKDEEWNVTKHVLTSGITKLQEEELKSLLNENQSPQAQKNIKDLWKTLVLGPEVVDPTSREKTRLHEKAVIIELTPAEDKMFLLRKLQETSAEKRTKILKQIHDFLHKSLSSRENILIARTFVSFPDPRDGDFFAEDIQPFKRGLTGRALFHAAQAWKANSSELLSSWRRLVSYSRKKSPSAKVMTNFLRLSSEMREKFLSLIPTKAHTRELETIYAVLNTDEEADLRAERIPIIEKLALHKEKHPNRYRRELKQPEDFSSDEDESGLDSSGGDSSTSESESPFTSEGEATDSSTSDSE